MVTLDDQKELPESEIVSVVIEDFVPPPRGKSTEEEYDLLTHIEKQ